MMFFNNYSKPGKGVEKRNPNQPRILTFFDILPRKIWFLFKLNLINILYSIPFCIIIMIAIGIVSIPMIGITQTNVDASNVVKIDIILRLGLTYLYMVFLGGGPSTAGYLYVIRKTVEERYCWLNSDFFEAYKTNFKRSTLLWIIDFFVFALLVVAFEIYGQSEFLVLQCGIVCIGCMYAMMHLYVYQMIFTFELPIRKILKNSLLIVIMKAPISILFMFLNVIIKIIIPASIYMKINGFGIAMILILCDVLFIAPILDFAENFYIIPMLKKHIGRQPE